jgi:uncharacterized protein YyaL (SSP411 family)
MDAVVAMTGHGGWPMTVFLTPGGEPFFGGTYFPPEERHGLPSFRQILAGVAQAYRQRPDEIARAAGQLVAAVRRSEGMAAVHGRDRPRRARRGTARPERQYDPVQGGFGDAPKFPPSSLLTTLLGLGREEATAMALHTLDRIAAGGIHDQIAGWLPSLCRGRRLARAALREDALRQRVARRRVHDGLAGDP